MSGWLMSGPLTGLIKEFLMIILGYLFLIGENYTELQNTPLITFTALWTNSADNKLGDIFSYFSQKTGFDNLCKFGDNLHET